MHELIMPILEILCETGVYPCWCNLEVGWVVRPPSCTLGHENLELTRGWDIFQIQSFRMLNILTSTCALNFAARSHRSLQLYQVKHVLARCAEGYT